MVRHGCDSSRARDEPGRRRVGSGGVGRESAMATAIGIARIGSKKQRLIELQLLCRELFSLNDQNPSVTNTKPNGENVRWMKKVSDEQYNGK